MVLTAKYLSLSLLNLYQQIGGGDDDFKETRVAPSLRVATRLADYAMTDLYLLMHCVQEIIVQFLAISSYRKLPELI